jgi:outer membrane PBP1 activator LpoA protein
VRDGFLAAAERAGAKGRARVIAHGDGRVQEAFGVALNLKPGVIIGPLVRDDMRAVSAIPEGPPTIALNQLDEGTPLPGWMRTFPLAIEQDARTLARRAWEDGVRRVAIVAGDSPLMRRFASGFTAEWLMVGGSAPQSLAFSSTPDGLAELRRTLARANADAIVIAVEGDDAALVKTHAARLPAYASAPPQRVEGAMLRDLQGVRFIDVPWLVAPDEPQFAGIARPDYPDLALQRLYALGIDAFRIASTFADGPVSRLAFEGATGRITLVDGRQFAREGRLATFHDGQIVPLEGAR